jgi:hypothetical protein
MNTLQLKKSTALFLSPFVLICFVLSPKAQAVPQGISPAPDGCYPQFTVAEGCHTLFNLTTGIANTGAGWYALFDTTTGNYNTALGAGALVLNTADFNTATGAAALLLNTSGTRNTANGSQTLLFNDTGNFNSAVGSFALYKNISGFSNNALGDSALFENIHGAGNTAIGDLALQNNDVTGNSLGNLNTAVGAEALLANTDGNSNNAVGVQALTANITGSFNEAFGVLALGSNDDGGANVGVGDTAMGINVSGNFNTMIGDHAGADLTSGDDNIYIGATAGSGITSESGTIRIGDPTFVTACYIAGINGQTASDGAAVFVDANGKLGTVTSSVRFKDDIKPMDTASESILALRPVTYHYKKEIDANRIPQFGLVAEDVAKVNPDLVIYGRDGKPYTVRYEAVNAMLLNEFLKEHEAFAAQQHNVEKLQATVAQQQKQIQALAAGLQKVNAQLATASPSDGGLELSKFATQTARLPAVALRENGNSQ